MAHAEAESEERNDKNEKKPFNKDFNRDGGNQFKNDGAKKIFNKDFNRDNQSSAMPSLLQMTSSIMLPAASLKVTRLVSM